MPFKMFAGREEQENLPMITEIPASDSSLEVMFKDDRASAGFSN